MKVDGNYKYDVMEGFEPLNMSRRMTSSDIGFSMGGNHLLFSSAAREILYQRKYVQIFVNRSTKDLMMVSAAEPSKNAIKLPESGKKTGICCSHLRKLIEEICRYDLDMVKMQIPGRAVKSKPNAVIFELTKAETEVVKKSGGK